jgi:hypothetical protein
MDVYDSVYLRLFGTKIAIPTSWANLDVCTKPVSNYGALNNAIHNI